jgi:gluconate 2-dehydrogenase gamma chain
MGEMMAKKADGDKSGISRRALLKHVGLAGAVAAVPVTLFRSAPIAAALEAPHAAAQTSAAEALETLTAAESSTLDAIVARLIPTDDNGPGAAEARAGRYIDRALGGALASSREAYRAGLAAVDRYARTSRGAPFQQLSPENQDAVLRDMENDAASGFAPASSSFFNLVRAHTIQGTFCDPYYGGNAAFVGWDLIGYPGLRLAVTPDEQRLDARVTPTHRSAYDHTMFSTKKPARASVDGGRPSHGD